jgi:hypothetical protein
MTTTDGYRVAVSSNNVNNIATKTLTAEYELLLVDGVVVSHGCCCCVVVVVFVFDAKLIISFSLLSLATKARGGLAGEGKRDTKQVQSQKEVKRPDHVPQKAHVRVGHRSGGRFRNVCPCTPPLSSTAQR